MPLNPEEVVNKRFSPTKFRQGYDEEEVDEFLDEVVAELRRLNAENDELRSKLTACEGRVSELSRGGASTAKAAEPTPTPAPTPAAAPVPVTPPTPAPTPVAAPAASGGAEGAAGMLALAQKLHDEHVAAGKIERTRIVSEAQEHAARLVREAEAKQRQTLGDLEQQRATLERKVEELRSFEREYRSRLKAYLEGQLRELESKVPAGGTRGSDSSASSGSTPDATPAAGPTSASGVTQLPSRGGFSGDQSGGDDRGGSQDPPRFPFGS